MIRRFQVENYKALRDITLNLTPIHVLIGPNDSGKTSVLEAIAALCRSVDQPLAQAFTGAWEGADLVWRNMPELPISLSAAVEEDELHFDYRLACTFAPSGRNVRTHEEQFESAKAGAVDLTNNNDNLSRVSRIAARGEPAPDEISKKAASMVHDSLSGVHLYRWNPRFLALPAAPDSRWPYRMDESGFGLVRCLDDILGYDRRRFTDLENRFREIFSHIRTIRL
ncbi:MAG: AAA family ATPase, partial [Candidatus Poribacteria bacterium]|nr:AAA family ATPase [Candidatus Poribacteria bacterium]